MTGLHIINLMKHYSFIFISLLMLFLSPAIFAEESPAQQGDGYLSSENDYNPPPPSYEEEHNSNGGFYFEFGIPNIFFFIPYTSYTSSSDKSRITITSNTPGASVYIDGYYRGLTPCNIGSIKPGHHALKVEKEHYETKNYDIYVKKGRDFSYYVDLEKISGVIDVTTEPAGAKITCDGINYSTFITSKFIEVDEGERKITVSAFGYAPYTTYISVQRNQRHHIDVKLEPMNFELQNLLVSRAEYNPQNRGQSGKETFTIITSAPGSGILSIYNDKKEVIWTEPVYFNRDRTLVYWNGNTIKGCKLEKGSYTVEVTANGSSIYNSFAVNPQVHYSTLHPTAGGGGIGPVSSAEIDENNNINLSFESQIIPLDREIWFSTSALWAPTENLELSAYRSVAANYKYNAWGINIKGSSPIPLGSTTLFIGGNMRYSSSYSWQTSSLSLCQDPGFGFSVLMGLKAGHVYIGLEGESLFNVYTDDPENNFMSWKTGALMEYSGRYVSVGIFGAYYGKPEKILESVTAGMDYTFNLTDSVFNLNITVLNNWLFADKLYLTPSISTGISLVL